MRDRWTDHHRRTLTIVHLVVFAVVDGWLMKASFTFALFIGACTWAAIISATTLFLRHMTRAKPTNPTGTLTLGRYFTLLFNLRYHMNDSVTFWNVLQASSVCLSLRLQVFQDSLLLLYEHILILFIFIVILRYRFVLQLTLLHWNQVFHSRTVPIFLIPKVA